MRIDGAGWEAGEPCARHELAWCGECLEMAGARRTAEGAVRYKNDCTVDTFRELTGCSYDDAITALEKVGLRPGRGLSRSMVVQALEDTGLRLRPVRTRYNQLLYASEKGARFYVSGAKGRKRHSWTIQGGKASRAFVAPFSFLAWEVTN